MKAYSKENIRNVAIAGHGARGKTTLAEAMLYLSGASDRLGKIADGNTVLDFDAEEKRPCLTEPEQTVFDQVQQGNPLVADIIAQTRLPAGAVLAALTMLEVKGLIARLPGKRVTLK